MAVPGWRSTSSERTPACDSRIEAVSPTGPPPTIRTGTSSIAPPRARLTSRLAHFAHDPPVAAVDVVAEDGGTVGAGCHRAVGDVEGHRVGKRIVGLLAGIDDLAHVVLAEAAASAKNLFDEVERVLQADAAMAEIAAAFG